MCTGSMKRTEVSGCLCQGALDWKLGFQSEEEDGEGKCRERYQAKRVRHLLAGSSLSEGVTQEFVQKGNTVFGMGVAVALKCRGYRKPDLRQVGSCLLSDDL